MARVARWRQGNQESHGKTSQSEIHTPKTDIAPLVGPRHRAERRPRLAPRRFHAARSEEDRDFAQTLRRVEPAAQVRSLPLRDVDADVLYQPRRKEFAGGAQKTPRAGERRIARAIRPGPGIAALIGFDCQTANAPPPVLFAKAPGAPAACPREGGDRVPLATREGSGAPKGASNRGRILSNAARALRPQTSLRSLRKQVGEARTPSSAPRAALVPALRQVPTPGRACVRKANRPCVVTASSSRTARSSRRAGPRGRPSPWVRATAAGAASNGPVLRPGPFGPPLSRQAKAAPLRERL